MTDEQKRECAEAIKAALGMSYGPPMEGEEGWVPPAAMTVEDADDEDAWDVLYGDVERTAKERAENAQAVIEAIREAKERRMAEELAKQRAKAAEPKPAPPSDDPWAVIGKAEDDGEAIMRETRRFC